ncbi:MAG: hypothetical protein U0791_00370 [Gemmataceae bacterium]
MIRFVVYAAVLYAGFVHNLFCVQEDVLSMVGEFRPGAMTGDCALVVNRIRLSDGDAWAPMAAWNGESWTPYRSQFGLPGIVLAAVRRATGESPERVAAFGSAICGLMSAALFAAFFSSIGARVAPVAGHVGVLLTACSPPLLLFAPTIYWLLPALLAPFVFAWFAYPWAASSTGRMALFLAGEAVLVCIKALCGYEYISTVVAAPAAAIVFHRAALGDGVRSWLPPVAAVGIAGSIGFAGAIGIHAAQIAAQTGEDGLAVIRERAESRTARSTGDGSERIGYPVLAPETLPEPVRCFANYFYQPVLSSPQTWGSARFAIPLGWLVSGWGLASVLLWSVRKANPVTAALVPAAAVALLAGASWQALAVNHMVLHGHRNLVVYCVPFTPLAFAVIGAAVARLGRPRAVAFSLAAAVIGVLLANLFTIRERVEASRESQAVAADRVRAMLRGESEPVPLAGRGPAPLLAPLPVNPDHLPSEPAFAPMCGPGLPAEERPIGAYGWVSMPRERTGRIPVSVVCVRGSEVVPARMEYHRLASVEQLLGKQAACVAFRAAIPPRAGPNERLRLFVVPVRSDLPIIELTSSEK